MPPNFQTANFNRDWETNNKCLKFEWNSNELESYKIRIECIERAHYTTVSKTISKWESNLRIHVNGGKTAANSVKTAKTTKNKNENTNRKKKK